MACLLSAGTVWAADYVAVAKDGKVFDDPSPKYVTLNEKNQEVNVAPGMVFKTTEHTPGWYLIEYSPGLHAYLSETVATNNFNPPTAGSYDIKNNPGHKLTVQNNNGNWSASADGKTYEGSLNGDILIFSDQNGYPAFSLVDLGQGPIAICYDNSVTHFF